MSSRFMKRGVRIGAQGEVRAPTPAARPTHGDLAALDAMNPPIQALTLLGL